MLVGNTGRVGTKGRDLGDTGRDLGDTGRDRAGAFQAGCCGLKLHEDWGSTPCTVPSYALSTHRPMRISNIILCRFSNRPTRIRATVLCECCVSSYAHDLYWGSTPGTVSSYVLPNYHPM
eukprot:1252965-Rhodomonas_salina.2